MQFADDLLNRAVSGFIVLSIDCLLVETIQQFRNGVVDGRRQSQKLVAQFLAGPRFQRDFDTAASKRFYADIRCGLLHRAEAKEMWLIRRRQPAMLQVSARGHDYILDVQRFHQAMQLSLDDYCEDLTRPECSTLRSALWSKTAAICVVRAARGAVYDADPLGFDVDPAAAA